MNREAATAGLDAATVEKLTLTTAAALYGIDLDVVSQPSPAIRDRLAAINKS